MKRTKVVWVSVFLAEVCKAFLFTSVDVSLNGGLASVDESGMPGTEPSQG